MGRVFWLVLVIIACADAWTVRSGRGRTGLLPPARRTRGPRRFGGSLKHVVAFSAENAAVTDSEDDKWSLSRFYDEVEAGGVERVVIAADGSAMQVHRRGKVVDESAQVIQLVPNEVSWTIRWLHQHDLSRKAAPGSRPPTAVDAVVDLLVTGAIYGGIMSLIARWRTSRRKDIDDPPPPGGGLPGGSIADFFKSSTKVDFKPVTGVDFSMIAGCDEAKRELLEVVEFLQDPGRFDKLGARCPRGVMLQGPPGTGKTLMARAVAAEAQVAFTYTSGSEFVEMFVGVGAARIRSIFAAAKKHAPCIIFIDEIDVVGKARAKVHGGSFYGANDEREQTLNQILNEMDGFAGNTGVIVLAATNRPETLDPALMRPGRFDRIVGLDLPDRRGREAILAVHAASKALARNADLATVARRTPGFSGADLANLLNEAAIYAVRRGSEEISPADLDRAIDRLTLGLERTTGGALNARRRLVAAWHEAGHATMAVLEPAYDPVAKISIVPRSGGTSGMTRFAPSSVDEDLALRSKRYLKAELAVALAGRVAEEIKFGRDEVTTGASDDLQHVRDLARKMVTQWGFASERHRTELSVGAWEGPDPERNLILGQAHAMSHHLEEVIDDEVRSLVDEAHDRCIRTLRANLPLVQTLVDEILQDDTVDGERIEALVIEHTHHASARPEPAAA